MLKTFEKDDDLFVKALSDDLAILETAIADTRGGRPLSKVEEAFKLKEIDRRMQKLGGRLQINNVLLDTEENPNDRLSEVDQLSDTNSEDSSN